jgi:poly(beta-D-mannuronate) lyase
MSGGKPRFRRALMLLVGAGLLAAAGTSEARTFTVASPGEFAAAIAAAAPGDTIDIAPGRHGDWKLVIPKTASGAAGQPIRIGGSGVTFVGKTSIEVRGSHVELAGFRFEGTGAPSVSIFGDHNRVTGLEFNAAGNRRKTHSPILVLRDGASDNAVDHCRFIASNSTSIQIKMSKDQSAPLPLRNWIHHNEFRNIRKYSKNGQEPIQVGQGPGNRRVLMTIVEHNLFVRASGDNELVSVKTSGNTIRHNVALDSDAGISLRGGDRNVVEGNVLLRTKRAIAVSGDGQTVINNFIDSPEDAGIALAVGSKRYRAATNAVIAHNTIVRADAPIRFMLRDSVIEALPRGNKIVNNILVARRGGQDLISANRGKAVADYLAGSEVARNVFWWPGGGASRAADPLYRNNGNIVADPQLDLSEPQLPQLAADSPARGKALPGYAETDITGAPRDAGTAPDVGALQASRP